MNGSGILKVEICIENNRDLRGDEVEERRSREEEKDRLVVLTTPQNAEVLKGYGEEVLKQFGYEILECPILPRDRVMMTLKSNITRNCPCEFVPFHGIEGDKNEKKTIRQATCFYWEEQERSKQNR